MASVIPPQLQLKWRCFCGWSGTAEELISQTHAGATGGKVCPGCGASGSLSSEYLNPMAALANSPELVEVTTAPVPGELELLADVRSYLLAGKAILTLANLESGVRCTYEVVLVDEDPTGGYFVDVLTGSNNEEDYDALGVLWDSPGLAPDATLEEGKGLCFRYYDGTWGKAKRRSKIPSGAPSARGFRWLVDQLNLELERLPHPMKVFHSGQCGRCRRLLTDPESVARGLGPVCAEKS